MSDLHVICSSPSSYGPWISAGAIVVSIIIALCTLRTNRAITRRKTTIDLLILEQTNSTLIEERKRFLAAREQNDLIKWLDESKASEDAAISIRTVLNKYEMISIGIKNDIFCEKIYKDWMRSTLVRDWCALRPYVYQLRTNQNSNVFYCGFENLAKKWAINDERNRV